MAKPEPTLQQTPPPGESIVPSPGSATAAKASASGTPGAALMEELATEIAQLYLLMRRPLIASGVSLARLRVLSRLYSRGPLRISQLARADQVSQPALTNMVGVLEREGLVQRRPHEGDGRGVVVSLTPFGTEELLRQRRIRGEVLARQLEMLPAAELPELYPMINTLRQLRELLSADDPILDASGRSPGEHRA